MPDPVPMKSMALAAHRASTARRTRAIKVVDGVLQATISSVSVLTATAASSSPS